MAKEREVRPSLLRPPQTSPRISRTKWINWTVPSLLTQAVLLSQSPVGHCIWAGVFVVKLSKSYQTELSSWLWCMKPRKHKRAIHKYMYLWCTYFNKWSKYGVEAPFAQSYWVRTLRSIMITSKDQRKSFHILYHRMRKTSLHFISVFTYQSLKISFVTNGYRIMQIK